MGSLLVFLKRARLLVMRWWNEDADLQTELLQMLGVTTIGSHSHVGSHGTWWKSPPPCSRVLMASFPKRSAKRLSAHQLSYASAGVYGTFSSMVPQMWQSSGFKSGEPEGHSTLLYEPVCIQLVLHDARTLRKVGCLGWNSIILSFSDIFQRNLAIKCIFDCWTVL